MKSVFALSIQLEMNVCSQITVSRGLRYRLLRGIRPRGSTGGSTGRQQMVDQMRRLASWQEGFRDRAREAFAWAGWRPTNYRALLERGSQLQAMSHALHARATYARRMGNASTSGLDLFMDFYEDHANLSRSQHAQDIFVMFATGMKRGGRFLEIGGGDGVSLSNSIALNNSLGWKGVIVEPDPTQYRLCRAFRACESTKVVKAAASPKGTYGEMTLHRAGVLSALSGFEGADGHQNVRALSGRVSRVRTIPLMDLLVNLPPLDYLSLDIEGAELEVLASVNWAAVRLPSILTVEHNGIDEKKRAISDLVAGLGYLEFGPDESWLTGQDSWYFHGLSLAI